MRKSEVSTNKVTKYINEHISGNVFDKPSILAAYAMDRSVLNITPRFVVIPNSTEDIQKVVRFVHDLADRGLKLPISVRGAGLSKTGSDLSEGIVISTENLDKIMEVDEDARLVRVQAGVTIEKLQAVLAAYGLHLPVEADPEATIAELIAEYTLDDLSAKYRGLLYYTERIEAVLGNGELLQTTPVNLRTLRRKDTSEALLDRLYVGIADLVDRNFDIISDIKAAPLDFAGYKMISRVTTEQRALDLMPLFFAADHTLGIITEVILRVESLPRVSHHLLATFKDADSAMPFIHAVRKEEPALLNLYDSNVIRIAAAHGKTSDIVPPLEKGYYVMASFDDNKFRAQRKIKHLLELTTTATEIIVEDQDNAEDFKNLKQLLDQFLNDENAVDRPAILDDVSIPEADLPDFLADLKVLEQTYEREMPIMGSVATGLYRIRPEFNLSDVSERKKSLEFMRSLATLVRNHHGSLTGGSAEGRVKGALMQLDQREKELYQKVKELFDPKGIFNPETKLGANLPDIARHLRTTVSSGKNS